MERRRASRRRSAALLLFLARQLGYLSSQLVHAIHDRLQSRIVPEGPGMAHRVGELHRVDEPVVLGAQLVEAGHPPMLALGGSRPAAAVNFFLTIRPDERILAACPS